MKYDYLFFDLDGTLTESGEGIINSVQYALKKNGIHEPDRKKLLAFIGPPLVESFQKWYGCTRAEAEAFTEDYREYYHVDGWMQNAVYPGVPEALKALKAQGRHLMVATSKPETFARKIIDYFGLTGCFEYVAGASDDCSRMTKSAVIAYALEQIDASAKVLMIGDRLHDVEGAAEFQIPCLGVLYGYGSREELLTAGAVAVCETALELPMVIAKIEE